MRMRMEVEKRKIDRVQKGKSLLMECWEEPWRQPDKI
jgi:hypothetical protein